MQTAVLMLVILIRREFQQNY